MIHIKNLDKKYGKELVLNQVNFTLETAKTLVIVGASGSGKSTLLKTIVGFERPNNGEITVNNTDITSLSIQQRKIVYIAQEATLFPHLSIFENLAFGLRVQKKSKADIETSVKKIAAELDISMHLNKMPEQLSGGQKQRVNVGRAIVTNPSILLLDEPFANLDPQTRQQLQQWFKRICIQFKMTSIFVTHDIREALVIGDYFAVMEKGTLEWVGNKNDFIRNPISGVEMEKNFWNGL